MKKKDLFKPHSLINTLFLEVATYLGNMVSHMKKATLILLFKKITMLIFFLIFITESFNMILSAIHMIGKFLLAEKTQHIRMMLPLNLGSQIIHKVIL